MRRHVAVLSLAIVVALLIGGGSAAAQSFAGPGAGGGYSGTISGSTFTYHSQSYSIVNGRVVFPDCTTYIVAPNGMLIGGSVIPNCTPSGGLTTPTITWATPASISVGTSLSGTQLNATASVGGSAVAGSFVYNPPAGTVMNTTGSHALSVAFTPTDTATYGSAAGSVTLFVTGVGGSFVGPPDGGGWSGTVSGGVLTYNGSQYQVFAGIVTFPDCTAYFVAPNGMLFRGAQATPGCVPGGSGGGGGGGGGTQTTPSIAWATPASVSTGTALSGAQLNATASAGGSSVAGAFVYNPAAGTVMNTAGSQTLSVTFTPTDTTTYSTATASVTLVVTSSGGGAFVGPSNGGGFSGTMSGSSFIYNGTSYQVTNGRVYFPDCSNWAIIAGRFLMAGAATPNCAPSGTPGGGGGGGSTTTPSITWPTPASITAGTALSATQLNATAAAGGSSVAGTFAYNPAAGTVMNTAGSQTLSVTFTPTDSTTYSTATATTTLVVTSAGGGGGGGGSSFVGPGGGGGYSGTASGQFYLYNGQRYPLLSGRVYFPDCTNYVVAPNGALFAGVAAACKTNPIITWAPAAVAYGTALSGTQLSAAANVAGVFTYSPAAGTVLASGTQTLAALFVPSDLATYAPVVVTTALVVNKATPSITWANPAKMIIGSALSATQLNAKANVAGTFTYVPPSGTTMSTAGDQTLSTTFTPTDATNYETVSASVTVAVGKASPPVSWATPAAITWGTALSATQLNASAGSVSGTLAYSHQIGTVLEPGTHTLSVTFTPTDTANYDPTTASVTLVVNKATPSITWANPADIAQASALSTTQLNATSNVDGAFVYSPAAGTVMTKYGSQTLSTTFTPADTTHYATVTATATVKVIFLNPSNGGPTSGTISGTTLTYNGTAFATYLVNGATRVTFPDCSDYLVLPSAAGFMDPQTKTSCTPYATGSTPNPQAPTTTGAIAATRVVASYPSAIWSFDVAYDALSERYLVVYYSANAVWGQYVGRDNNPIGTTFVIGYGGIFLPRVAANGKGTFAVVYTVDFGGSYARYAQLIEVTPSAYAPSGVSSPVQVAAGSDYTMAHRSGVAWNGVLNMFQIAWSYVTAPGPGRVGTYLTGLNLNNTLTTATLIADPPLCGNGEYLKRTMPQIAVAADGSALVVGYSDSTSPNCKSLGGLWYRPISSSGAPLGTVGIVHGATDGDLHREQQVAYNSVSNSYLVAWARGGSTLGTVWAQKFDGTGARDGSAYVARAPIPFSGSNGALGQVGMAYDAAANQYELAVRDNDPGNGLAPVYRFRLKGDGTPDPMAPARAESASVDPWPVIAADNLGNFLILYRLDYSSRLQATLVTPDGQLPTTANTVPTGGGTAPTNPGTPGSLGQVGVTKIVTYGGALANPDLAYDKSLGRYLMVFYHSNAVRGVFLDNAGNSVSSQFVIDMGSIFHPRVAADGSGTFMVTYTVDEGGVYRRRVKKVDATGVASPAVGIGSTGWVIAVGGDYTMSHRSTLAWNPVLNYFQVAWAYLVGAGGIGQIGTYVTGVRTDGSMTTAVLVANSTLCAGSEYLKYTLPEIAVAADGSALVVGYRDSTSVACKPFGGLWYRTLGIDGAPTGSTGLVLGGNDSDLHREHRVAYNSVLNTYLVAWARGGISPGTVWGQRFDGTGARVNSSYIVRMPILGNGSNGAIGQVGMAYDPTADQFEVAVRGNDPGNGLSPVFRFRVSSDGTPANMSPTRIEAGAFDPWPVVASDGMGNFLIMYRISYDTRIALTPITP